MKVPAFVKFLLPPQDPKWLAAQTLLVYFRIYPAHSFTERARLHSRHVLGVKNRRFFFWPISWSRSIWIKGSVNSCYLCSARAEIKQNGPVWAVPAWDESLVLTGLGPWAGIDAFRSIGSFRKTRRGAIMRWSRCIRRCFSRKRDEGLLCRAPGSCATLKWMHSGVSLV